MWYMTREAAVPTAPPPICSVPRLVIAYNFWKQYLYTKDETFLREQAYPIIKGVAKFFMNFPLTQKGEDGKYHIDRTCTGEAYFGCTDGMENVAGMRAMAWPYCLRRRVFWVRIGINGMNGKRFAKDMAPLPTTAMEGDNL